MGRMERTINGKTLPTILEELSKPFDSRLFKENLYGYSYLPVEVYRERLDEVVGVLNYDVTISSPELVTVGSRPQIMLKAAITLKDDNGNIVVTKESPGGCAVIFANTSGEAVSLKNDEESAAGDAFKRCCKMFGMATKQLKDLRDNKKETSLSRSDEAAIPTELYRVTIKEKFSKMGKSDGYSAKVALENGTVTTLVIWKNAQEKIAEKISFEKFLECYLPGKSFSLYGKRTTFTSRNGQRQEQLVMESPYCGGE